MTRAVLDAVCKVSIITVLWIKVGPSEICFPSFPRPRTFCVWKDLFAQKFLFFLQAHAHIVMKETKLWHHHFRPLYERLYILTVPPHQIAS
jgi:hypothetical protein